MQQRQSRSPTLVPEAPAQTPPGALAGLHVLDFMIVMEDPRSPVAAVRHRDCGQRPQARMRGAYPAPCTRRSWPAQYGSRSTRRTILPTGVFGSVSTKCSALGTLK